MTTKIDFYGESTFRGYVAGVERDNPTPSSLSNPDNAVWGSTVGPDTKVGTDYANVPRRTVERLTTDAGFPSTHKNYAVSSTAIERILNGGYGVTGGINTVSGGSDACIVVVNTGINDAAKGTSVSAFRTSLAAVLQRIVRTGKIAVVVQPNTIAAPYNTALTAYFSGFSTWLASLGTDVSANTVFVSTSVGNADDFHPNNAGYEYLSWRIAGEIIARPNKADLVLERTIAELYIMFFNRACESGGADFWLADLKSKGEVFVAQNMYNAVPAMVAMTPTELINTWYSNLFSEVPDTEGLNFWLASLSSKGVGTTARDLLNAVRAQTGTAHKLKLVHRANVGVAYGYRLKRSAVNTTAMLGVTTDPSTVYTATQSL